jgi:hypothetical protein
MADDIELRASKARALLADETFKTFFEELKQRQTEIFFNSAPGDFESREEAYSIVSALNKIEAYLQSAITDEKILKKRK